MLCIVSNYTNSTRKHSITGGGVVSHHLPSLLRFSETFSTVESVSILAVCLAKVEVTGVFAGVTGSWDSEELLLSEYCFLDDLLYAAGELKPLPALFMMGTSSSNPGGRRVNGFADVSIATVFS